MSATCKLWVNGTQPGTPCLVYPILPAQPLVYATIVWILSSICLPSHAKTLMSSPPHDATPPFCFALEFVFDSDRLAMASRLSSQTHLPSPPMFLTVVLISTDGCVEMKDNEQDGFRKICIASQTIS